MIRDKKTFLLTISIILNVVFLLTGLSYTYRKGFSLIDIPNKIIKARPTDSSEREFYIRHASIYYSCIKYHNANQAIVFLGDSITHNAPWHEFFNSVHVINRGINGDDTTGLIKRLDAVTVLKPKKIFLMIGTNDIDRKKSVEQIVSNINFIIDDLSKKSPNSKIYLQSITPVRGYSEKYVESIKKINIQIKAIAERRGHQFIDIYPPLADATGNLSENYTFDGLHLNGSGYAVWVNIIKPYVLDH